MIDINSIPSDKPVLLAGATASGKTALAIRIARAQDRPVLNADAMQVYGCWQVLTARPGPEEQTQAAHHLYGHVPFGDEYSVGQWLRELSPWLTRRPVIVGGTGLYFRALTDGLAEIPPTPPAIRAEGDALPTAALLAGLDAHDPILAARIDRRNRARIQRGWEVWRATGRPLSSWQDRTPPPALPLAAATPLLLDADRDWLNDRIARRFDRMLERGALQEARAVLPRWPIAGGARKAIGAPELIAHLRGECTLAAARDAAIVATRQYAKRQRSWFRSNMQTWRRIALP